MTTLSEKQAATIRIPLTAGNLRNGHVYVRNFLWFFPKSAIRGERIDQGDLQPCVLELAGFGTIETEIDADKAIFRWRGWKKFFRQQGVAQGDHLIITRVERDRFSVSVEHAVLDGLSAYAQPTQDVKARPLGARPRKRCNDLSGDEWLRYSLSIWSDIRKTPQEMALKHPAMFPTMLCERLMMMLLRRKGKHRVLDPFMGSGSTIVAARGFGKVGIGFDISSQYIEMAKSRLEAPSLFHAHAAEYTIYQADAHCLLDHVKPNSIDICITSPPYWDILNQKRTADSKQIRHYGNLEQDLGTIEDYAEFLECLGRVFEQVLVALRPCAYCVVVVMDLRKKDRFYPFHSDLASRLTKAGFVLDDTIIWDRAQEYNNLRPLGFPSVFRVNKIHEFIMIFRKPAG